MTSAEKLRTQLGEVVDGVVDFYAPQARAHAELVFLAQAGSFASLDVETRRVVLGGLQADYRNTLADKIISDLGDLSEEPTQVDQIVVRVVHLFDDRLNQLVRNLG